MRRDAHWVQVENGFSVTSSGPLSRLKIVRSPIMPSDIVNSLASSKEAIMWETVFGK